MEMVQIIFQEWVRCTVVQSVDVPRQQVLEESVDVTVPQMCLRNVAINESWNTLYSGHVTGVHLGAKRRTERRCANA